METETRTLGLIGGMSWHSTATYYRLVNEAVAAERGGHASARIVLQSLDFSEIALMALPVTLVIVAAEVDLSVA